MIGNSTHLDGAFFFSFLFSSRGARKGWGWLCAKCWALCPAGQAGDPILSELQSTVYHGFTVSTTASVGKGMFGDLQAFCNSSCDVLWSTLCLEICMPSVDISGCLQGLKETVPPPCRCVSVYPPARGGGVGDLPLLFHSGSIGSSKQKGNKGVFVVGEGEGWGGRCISACVTGGWYHGGERHEESCKNREAPPG